MARIKKSLRNMRDAMLSFFSFAIGREEGNAEEQALPTQHNQYYT